MKRSILIVLFLFAFYCKTMAQDLPTIVPPSPEAASFGKFTEVPISHYTGLPNISVPMASFEVGGKTFPVGIGYHARGVQVEEISSRVGIGWALNAGGQISRQIRGKADDELHGYVNRDNILMENLWQTGSGQGFFGDDNIRDQYQNHDLVYQVDRFPDQYSLQVGNLSAKFIFNYYDDQPLLQSYDDIVIEKVISGGLIVGFVVIDKDGFKYYFGRSKDNNRNAQDWEQGFGEYVIHVNGDYDFSNSDFYLKYTTWHLMDIESPSGEMANLTYEDQVSDYYRRSFDKSLGGTDAVCNASHVRSHQYQLKEIAYDGGKITFAGNDIRQDVSNGGQNKELDSVKVYDNNDDLIRSFELYQSYPATVSDNNQNPVLDQFDTKSSKRLRLDSIVEKGSSGNAKPPYVFTYNSQPMPNRFSNSQDLWGYYNGKNNGSFLLYYGYGSGGLANNRTIDTLKSMAGILEKITYPTGGSARFTYEHNRGVLGSEFDGISFPFVNPTTFVSTGVANIDSHNGDYYYKNIPVVHEAFGLVKLTVSLPTIGGTDHNVACANPPQMGCGFDIRLEGINGTPYNYTSIFPGEQYVDVQPGEYRLIVDPLDPNWNFNPLVSPYYFFVVTMSWYDQSVDQEELLFAAGKRIKKIEFLDSADNVVSSKEYSYLNSNGNESGVILSVPSFNVKIPGTTNLYALGSAIPGSGYTTFQGNTIGYQYVTEYYGDAGDNHGKTDYQFSMQKDTGNYLYPPVTPPTDNEWLRGLPVNTVHYKQESNGSYKKVKSISYRYVFGNDLVNGNPDAPALLPEIFTPPSDILGFYTNLVDTDLMYEKTGTHYRLPLINLCDLYDSNGNSTGLAYKVYHYTGGTLGSYSTTEILYDDNGDMTLSTETKTRYSYGNHYQPARITSVTSDGMPVAQTFTYPQDILSQNRTTEEQGLVNQNRLVPIEVRTYKDADADSDLENTEQTGITVTTYAFDGSVLEPSLIQVGKDYGSSLKDRIEFGDYDDKGNLLQVSRANGMDITYIYGYNKTLPIAKLENATSTQVQSYVSYIQNLSDFDDDHCMDSGSCDEKDLRTALNALRSTFPNAMVTTYTYDPLVGVTSITDPQGQTVYFEYDEHGRLERARDKDGKILSENEYHYLLD